MKQLNFFPFRHEFHFHVPKNLPEAERQSLIQFIVKCFQKQNIYMQPMASGAIFKKKLGTSGNSMFGNVHEGGVNLDSSSGRVSFFFSTQKIYLFLFLPFILLSCLALPMFIFTFGLFSLEVLIFHLRVDAYIVSIYKKVKAYKE